LIEVKEKRTKYTKTYDVGEGNFEIKNFSEPVHFKKNGKWFEIDTTINKETLSVEDNAVRVYFEESPLTPDTISLESDLGFLSYTPISMRWSNGDLISEVLEGEISIKDNVFNYLNEFPNADDEFVVNAESVKDNIILSKLENPPEEGLFLEFVDEIRFEGSLVADGEKVNNYAKAEVIEVRNQRGQKAFTIPELKIIADDGKVCFGEYIVKKESDKWLLISRVAYDKIKDMKFPINIDPNTTIAADLASGNLAMVDSSQPEVGGLVGETKNYLEILDGQHATLADQNSFNFGSSGGDMPGSVIAVVNSINNNAMILSKTDSGSDNYEYTFSYISSLNALQVRFYSGSGQFTLYKRVSFNPSGRHVLGFTYDGSQEFSGINIYIDGELQTNIIDSYKSNYDGAVYGRSIPRIGVVLYQDPSYEMFSVFELFELSFFNLELSAQEMENYSDSVDLDSDGLVSYYDFSNEGDIIVDRVGNNDGDVNNTTKVIISSPAKVSANELTLMQFPNIPKDENITKASLNFKTGNFDGVFDISIRKVLESWDGNSVTYDTMPQLGKELKRFSMEEYLEYDGTYSNPSPIWSVDLTEAIKEELPFGVALEANDVTTEFLEIEVN